MKTQTNYKTEEGLVQNLRKIRDQISSEIKDMTFEQERAYLDKLLIEPGKASTEKQEYGAKGSDEQSA